MKKLKALLVAGVAVLGLAACSDEGNEPNETVETITVTDRNGEVEVPVNPQNVVVLDLGTADALDYLGVDMVGIPQGTRLPEHLAHLGDGDIADAGGLRDVDLEAIYEMNPDIIFMSGRQQEVQEELEAIAPTVWVTIDATDYIGSFTHNMQMFGEIFEKQDEVEAVLETVNARIEEVNSTVTELGLNALITMINEDSVRVFGSESRFGIIHNTLGFVAVDETIEVVNHGQQASVEYILETNPDVLFVVDRQLATGTEGTAVTILDNELVDQTNAAQNDNIIFLDSAVWYLVTGGVRSTLQMIDEVESALK